MRRAGKQWVDADEAQSEVEEDNRQVSSQLFSLTISQTWRVILGQFHWIQTK